MKNKYSIFKPSILSTKKEKLISYLKSDIGYADLSSMVIPEKKDKKARLFSKKECVLAGLEEAAAVFGLLHVPVSMEKIDGENIEGNTTVLKLNGKASSILGGERVALNIISRMSGIATLTRSLVVNAREINPDVKVACTRKTTPGFDFFEKKAVIIGGGDPHRFRLDDAVMLKDNHLACLSSITKAVKKAKEFSFSKKVEVEVETLDNAVEAAKAGADIVMLDNMSGKKCEECAKTLKEDYSEIIIEVSGGITPENIKDYASHADVISLGYLTHSYKSIDFSVEFE